MSMKQVSHLVSRKNGLLDALSAAAYQRLCDDLEFVPMPQGCTIVEAGVRSKYIYFPTTSVVSMIRMTLDGHATDVGQTGKEGLVGFELLSPGDYSSTSVVVRCAGFGYRLGAEAARREFMTDSELLKLILGFVHALSSQVSQIAVCNRFHSARQQMCRAFLMILDRVGGDELVMTQDLISAMVGVRRETVSEVASDLQTRGIIKYRRGRILVVDRAALEHAACECYSLLRREYERVLPFGVGSREPQTKTRRQITSIRRTVPVPREGAMLTGKDAKAAQSRCS